MERSGDLWRSLAQVPPGWGPSAVTLGVFDGVHLGHQALLAETVRAAGERGLAVAVVTFDPHPMAVLRPEQAPKLLTPPEDRARLLRELGAGAVLALPFDAAMSRWTPSEFVDRVLRDSLHAAVVLVGEDFRFGARAAGDIAALADLGRQAGFEVVAFGAVGDGELERVSSSQIRRLLEAGDVAAAARLLGRPHRLRGPVVRGDARGRELGYPTANVDARSDAVIPADGIYAGRLAVGEDSWPAAISIGTNPTFDGAVRRVEAYALDRDDLELYDLQAEIDFTARLRPTVRFESVEELVAQMAVDVEAARRLTAGDPGF